MLGGQWSRGAVPSERPAEQELRGQADPLIWAVDAGPVTAAAQDILPITVSVRREHLDGFNNIQVAQKLGQLCVVHADVTPCTVRRTSQDIARAQLGSLGIISIDRGTIEWNARFQRDTLLRVGDIALVDADECFSGAHDGVVMDSWLLPLADLDPRVVDCLAGGVQMRRGDGRTDLLRSYLLTLRDQGSGLSATTLDRLSGHFRRLLEITASDCRPEEVEGGVEAVASTRLMRIRREIERRLTDPLLSPARVADACGLSVRSLHLLFESEGESFSRFVLRRRLDRARAALANPELVDRPVTDIAFALGFNSLSTFHLRYRERFGYTPGATRRRP